MRLIAKEEFVAVVGGTTAANTVEVKQVKPVEPPPSSALVFGVSSGAVKNNVEVSGSSSSANPVQTAAALITAVKNTVGVDAAVNCTFHVDNKNDKVNWSVDCTAKVSGGMGGRTMIQ